MQKKIILFVILSALLVLGSCGISYATTIDEIIADLQVLGENGVVGQDIYQTIQLPANFNNHSQYFIMVTQGTKGTVPNVSRQPSKLNANRRLYIYTFDGNIVTNTNNSPSNDLYYYWNASNKDSACYNYQTGVTISQGSYALGDSIEPFYLYTTCEINTRLIHLGAGEEYGGSYLSKQIDFSPTYTDIVNYGDYNNVYAQKVRQNIVYFGTLNTDTNTYKYFRFKLFDTYGEEIGWLDYNVDNDYYSSNVLSAFLPPLKVYIERRLIWLNEVYTLVIYASDEPLNNDNTNSSDSIVLTYVFLRENATISGGTITNTGSGDNYTNQDSANDIINNINNSTNDINNTLTDTSEANDTINNFFSGDADSFANSIGYSPIENPFVAIIRNTLTSLVNVFLGNGNVTLQISWAGENITLNSDDFTLPSGPIKTFIALICNGFLLWAIVKYGFVLYQWINSGRLQNMVNEVNGHWYKMLF